MDTVLFFVHIRGLIPPLVFNFRVEEKFVGGKFRGRKISRNSMRSGYLFRGRKISRKIQIREYSEKFLHAKNTCYTVFDTQQNSNAVYMHSPVIQRTNSKKYAG